MTFLVLGLIIVVFTAVATSQEPAPIPPLPGRHDDLAMTPRDWTEVTEDEGPMIDLVGVQAREAHPLEVEVAYGIRADAAAVEGTLLIPDRPGGTPLLVANTGVRFHWITFDPPLTLADGSVLEHILPRLLDWSEREIEVEEEGLGFAFVAEVAFPDEAGWSPPEEDQAAPSGITLEWILHVVETPDAGRDGFAISPANAHLGHRIMIPDEALDEATRGQLDATNVTFSFRYDFVRATPGIVVEGPAPLDAHGIYLVHGQAAATLRFVDVAEEPRATYAFTDRPGDPLPQSDLGTLAPPLVANATTPLTFGLFDNETHGARTRTELGYLYQFPSEETPSPSPTPPTDEDETPAPALIWVLLSITVAVWVARRTRAPSS